MKSHAVYDIINAMVGPHIQGTERGRIRNGIVDCSHSVREESLGNDDGNGNLETKKFVTERSREQISLVTKASRDKKVSWQESLVTKQAS